MQKLLILNIKSFIFLPFSSFLKKSTMFFLYLLYFLSISFFKKMIFFFTLSPTFHSNYNILDNKKQYTLIKYIESSLEKVVKFILESTNINI